jgi:hypothetical protein
MILETCQMLVTARVMRGELSTQDVPEDCIVDGRVKYHTYRMRNHPCSKWVREDRTGFIYAQDLLRALCDEFTYRFGKVHATDSFYFGALPKADINKLFPHRRRRKPVPLATGEKHPLDADPVEVYRRFYETKGDRWELQWTNRERPFWYRTE